MKTANAGNKLSRQPLAAGSLERWNRDWRWLVISDLHIGSRYFLRSAFMNLLDRLPPNVALVLNGDVVDQIYKLLPEDDLAVLERLRCESRRRPVHWIYGNHDTGLRFERAAGIRFAHELVIEKKLYLAHGHGFDAVIPAHRWFVRLFRGLHHMRIACGAEAVHVAVYAKRWDRLYRVLRQHVQRNAIRYAHRCNCRAVACGHTHYPEDRLLKGVRYVNTGSWTETPVYGLAVGRTAMDLLRLVG